MKKILNKTNLLVAFLFAFVACLTAGAATLRFTAHAQEEEPKSTVEFTSYTSIMGPDETYEFAAQATAPDGTVTDVLTWTSSDTSVIVMEENLAIAQALEEGVTEKTATITATAEDGGYASIDVLVTTNEEIRVQSIEIYPEVLELGIGWTTRMSYTVLPDDSYERSATWASSDPSVITVDSNGNIEAIAAGTAEITVTARDSLNGATATCAVVVYENFEEATLTPATLVTTIGQVENNTMKLELPDGVTPVEESFHWYSMDDTIASIDPNSDEYGTIYSWNFGTTTIYAVAHGSDGKVYSAMGTIHVTASYFYITGLISDLDDPTGDPWVTYDTEAEAQAAGVLLVPSTTEEYVYSITRTFWANDYFQIIHGGIDQDWTTKITSTSFSEEGSTMAYVANTADSFGMSALGSYTVTLDLSDGRAKVTIQKVDLVVTDLVVTTASSNAYLQFTGPEGAEDPAAARTMLLNVETLPSDAEYDIANVTTTIPENFQNIVSAEAIEEAGVLQIKLTLNQAQNTTRVFNLGIQVENATALVAVTILADGETYVPATKVTFENAPYILNVNNGAAPWNTLISASADSDASVKDVSYSCVYADGSENSHVWFEVIDDKTYVHADALGTYTITATSLSNPNVSADTTVLVTSLVGTAPNYTTGFYLIGMLDGIEVEDWTSIKPEVTDFTGSAFANWTLEKDREDDAIYSGTFNLREHDRFSIAFLGMDGNWGGIINNQYMNWEGSEGTYWYNDINIEMSENGRYTVTLDLSGEGPSFTIRRVGDYNPDVDYRMWLYIARSGDAWDGAVSDEANVIARIGYIDISNGEAQTGLVLTSEAIDFYEFYTTTEEWPTIQFVTTIEWDYKEAEEPNYGIIGGAFQSPTWYGEAHQGVEFGGNAYLKTVPDEGANYFSNYEGRCELFWAAKEITSAEENNMTVRFTFTFDEGGVLTNVNLVFVSTTTEVPAE